MGITNGEIIDVILYNITRKLEKIDLISNIKGFFEFLALGGASSIRNSWLWEGFSEIFMDYFEVF